MLCKYSWYILTIIFMVGFVKTQCLDCITNSEVKFYLYTNANPINPIKLSRRNLTGTFLDVLRPFKFLIHGYMDSSNGSWILKMKDEYLKKDYYNIITVDWSERANLIYPISVSNTKGIGKYIALFIIDFHNTLGVPYDKIHVIGHSLGAHVSGFAGQYLQKIQNEKVSRITGLDPAGPLFNKNNSSNRISKGDAKFVDIIHTNGFEYGYYQPCGDIDFYPNGGVIFQPGCLTRRKRDSSFFEISCSHARARYYFIESIRSSGFIANKCSSYGNYLKGLCKQNQVAVMGENIGSNLSGIFYLKTNFYEPYAKLGAL